MAKPNDVLPEFASQTDYTSGPKVSRPTKSADLGAGLAVQGHIPGSDPADATAANEFNAWLNLCSLYGRWVGDGSFEPDLTAHIVETDSGGNAHVAQIEGGNTSFAGPAGLFQKNASGPVIQVIADEAQGILIQSTSTTAGSPQSISIDNDRTGLNAHIIEVTSGFFTDTLGGCILDVATDGVLSSTGINARQLSALNAVNFDGTAVEGISGGIHPAGRFLNTMDAATSLKVGFGFEDTSPSNAAGIGIETRGGDGNPTFGHTGGVGISARGGDAVDGAIDSAGGAGIFAKGGNSATEMGGPGVHCQSTGDNSNAMVVEHVSATTSTPLATFDTGNNTAQGIVVTSEGFGDGILVNAEGGNGIRIIMTPEGVGSNIDAALALIPQEPPTTPVDGDIWVETSPGPNRSLRTSNGGVGQYVQKSSSPWCAASVFVAGAPEVNGITLVDITTLAFSPEQQPSATGFIILRAYGSILGTAGTEDAVGLAIYDDTAATQIESKTVGYYPGSNVGDVHIMARYELPASGARTFSVRYNFPAGTPGTGNTAVNWLFEISAAPEPPP